MILPSFAVLITLASAIRIHIGRALAHMKIGIAAKLFLAVLVACAAVMVTQSIVTRISFQRGFIGYLNEQGRQRMEESLPHLIAAYRQHGSWEFLRHDRTQWFRALRPARANENIAPQLSVADESGAVIRMGLLDTRLRWIAGNPQVSAASIRRPVVVDGRMVGWIAMLPFETALAPGESRFLEQQRKALWTIVVISLGVVALLTFVLTRTLLKRVRRLAQATHALAAGDYAARIQAGGRDELGTLAQDFNRMAQALEHNERARRTFMADISHELRTPLAVVRAEIEAIQDGIRPPAAKSLEVMHQQVGRLGDLIDDLHDLSLTDVGALAYRRLPIDLITVLQTALESMRGRFEAAELQLDDAQIPHTPLIINGDEKRLQQLFCNLLENALRYTAAGGVVRVRCTPREASATVIFEDSAPGVPDDKLAFLFERFYRVEASRNRASGGSGLGLAICRNIVEAHDGRIAAEASSLGGLRITIQLPLSTS